MSTQEHKGVLVIDENESVLDLLKAMLEIAGLQVTISSSHGLGFLLAKEIRPKVICVDVGRTPEHSFDFTRRLRQDKELSDTYLIALSAWIDDVNLAKIDEAGFDTLLTKPISMELLVEHVEAGFAKIEAK